MKSDVFVKDPMKQPISPTIISSGPIVSTPSRFRRKKQYTGETCSPYNSNFKAMPKDF